MSYYLAGTLRNEFEDNNNALMTDDYTTNNNTTSTTDSMSYVSYGHLSDHYDFHTDLVTVVIVLVLMGIIYKTIWLVVLRMSILFQQRKVQRKVIGMRRYSKRIITATLRWQEEWQNRHNHHDGNRGGDGEEGGGGGYEFSNSYSPYQQF